MLFMPPPTNALKKYIKLIYILMYMIITARLEKETLLYLKKYI